MLISKWKLSHRLSCQVAHTQTQLWTVAKSSCSNHTFINVTFQHDFHRKPKQALPGPIHCGSDHNRSCCELHECNSTYFIGTFILKKVELTQLLVYTFTIPWKVKVMISYNLIVWDNFDWLNMLVRKLYATMFVYKVLNLNSNLEERRHWENFIYY